VLVLGGSFLAEDLISWCTLLQVSVSKAIMLALRLEDWDLVHTIFRELKVNRYAFDIQLVAITSRPAYQENFNKDEINRN
jgi:hypothetical protein